MLSRRAALITAALACGGAVTGCIKKERTSGAATGPLATLEATPSWKISMSGARITDYHPRLGTLALTKGGKEATLTAVTPDGTNAWTTTIPSTDPGEVDLAWIAAGTADLVTAFDKTSQTLTIWDATSTRPRLTQTAAAARLGAAGVLTTGADGSSATLTLTGGTTPAMTPLSSPGTPLAATTSGHYLTLDANGALALNGKPLPDAGKGAPTNVTLTQTLAAADWEGLTVAWDLQGATIAKVNAASSTPPQRRPVSAQGWSTWGAMAWSGKRADEPITLPQSAAAILQGAAYQPTDAGTSVTDLLFGAAVATSKVTSVGAPASLDHLITFDGTTLASWPLRPTSSASASPTKTKGTA